MLAVWATLVALPVAGRHSLAPPGATNVILSLWSDGQGQSCQHITYVTPPGWLLLDQYRHLESLGLRRDLGADQMLRRSLLENQPQIFAIFIGRQLNGLVSERAIVAMMPGGERRAQVSVARCLDTGVLTGWF